MEKWTNGPWVEEPSQINNENYGPQSYEHQSWGSGDTIVGSDIPMLGYYSNKRKLDEIYPPFSQEISVSPDKSQAKVYSDSKSDNCYKDCMLEKLKENRDKIPF